MQLVSATEVMSCLIFCLLPWKGTQLEKFLPGLSTLLHFPADVDCSPLPALKYSPRTPTSPALLIFVLPCSVTRVPSRLPDGDQAETATHAPRAGQRRNKTGRSVRRYPNSCRTPPMLCLGTDYKTDAFSLILRKNKPV